MDNTPWMQRMFDSASRRYILLNKILTLGQDGIWRQNAVKFIAPTACDKILDICSGTADLALKVAQKFPKLTVYTLDYSQEMLAIARERAKRQGRDNLILEEGNCTSMEFESNFFDYITISFGFRNLSYTPENLALALKEVRRVLKIGGKFIILETSQPLNIFVRKFFHFYSLRVVPIVGRLFSGKKEPYAYLGNSIVRFFSQDKLTHILEAFGFKKEGSVSFLFGMILLCVFKKVKS